MSVGPFFAQLQTGKLPPVEDSMRYEALRLATYHKRPRGKNISASKLANAGFYYEGAKDSVACFKCGLRVDDWGSMGAGVDPLEVHMQRSPECAFLSNGEKENIPYTVRESELTGEAKKLSQRTLQRRLNSGVAATEASLSNGYSLSVCNATNAVGPIRARIPSSSLNRSSSSSSVFISPSEWSLPDCCSAQENNSTLNEHNFQAERNFLVICEKHSLEMIENEALEPGLAAAGERNNVGFYCTDCEAIESEEFVMQIQKLSSTPNISDKPCVRKLKQSFKATAKEVDEVMGSETVQLALEAGFTLSHIKEAAIRRFSEIGLPFPNMESLIDTLYEADELDQQGPESGSYP